MFFFFYFKCIYFNWRLITLQYCGGFCHTLTWISHGCTCVLIWNSPPTSSPSHSSEFFQCIGFECPVSCIKLGLMIYFTYGNIHVLMLVSQIIPPLPSPTESKSLYFISVSFTVSHIGSSLPSFYIPYICVNILYWCFSSWLTSLWITGSSFFHLIWTGSNVFF